MYILTAAKCYEAILVITVCDFCLIWFYVIEQKKLDVNY